MTTFPAKSSNPFRLSNVYWPISLISVIDKIPVMKDHISVDIIFFYKPDPAFNNLRLVTLHRCRRSLLSLSRFCRSADLLNTAGLSGILSRCCNKSCNCRCSNNFRRCQINTSFSLFSGKIPVSGADSYFPLTILSNLSCCTSCTSGI